MTIRELERLLDKLRAFCFYCEWASQSRDLEDAIEQNDAHERTHPEWTEPPTLEEWRDEMHADHECTPGRCLCKCGCQNEMGCTVLFGGMCSTCLMRELRGEEDEHGDTEQSVDNASVSAAVGTERTPQDSKEQPRNVTTTDRADDRAVPGWLPIDTAPKDGTNILLFDGVRVSVGGWMSAADQGAEPGEEHLIAAGWWSLDLRDNQPTHWMPLPDPPSDTPQTGAPDDTKICSW